MAIPAAEKVQAKTGIPWQAIVAVSANETGWGKAVAGNNYFGIKGSNPDTGANTGAVDTWEVVNGQRVNIKDTFRAYGGYEESAMDFARFLQTNSRYQPAMRYLKVHPSDWRGFLRLVHDAGYATDPNWSDQVVSIGNGLEGVEAADSTRPSKLGHDQDTQRVGITGLLDKASTALGSKYQWGGSGGRTNFDPKFVGSDCSGFVAWAYAQATGLKLNAQTSSMFQQTSSVRAANAMPGDLVFYNMGEGAHMEHVGIYAGNGMMIHDSSLNPNGGVDITPLWSGAQFRRVDGVDPTLYNRSQGGGMRSSPTDVPTEWVVTVEHGRQIVTLYTPSGIKKDDLGKADYPDGTVLGHSGEGDMGMGSGAEADPDLSRHLGGSPPSLSDLAAPDMGKPYVFGAAHDPQNNPVSSDPNDHEAYDCSSFVSSMARRQGYDLTPFTDRMFDETQAVNPGEEQPGDLIFYQYSDPMQKGVKFPHVGIYMGDGRTLEARYDAKGGGVGEYEQLNPSRFRPVFRRMAKPSVGQSMGSGADLDGDGIDDDTGLPVAAPAPVVPDPDLTARLGGGYTPPAPAPAPAPEPEPAAPEPAPEPAAPVRVPLSVPERKPISPTAPPVLKPGESLDKAVQEGTVPETLASGAQDVARATSDMAGGVAGAVGGVFSGLGSLGRKAADTAGQAAADLNQAVMDTEPGAPLAAATEAVAQTAGDVHAAAQELGATPVEQIGGDIAQTAGEAHAAAQELGAQPVDLTPVANSAQQSLVDEYTRMLQDPVQYAHDLTQNATVQAAVPMGAGPLLGMTPGVADSIQYLASNGYDADHVNQALVDMSHPDPAKRPASAKVAAGGTLNPVEGVQFITEAMDAHNDLRRSIAEATQSPEIRESDEGKWAAEGAAFVTDPQNLLMIMDPAIGLAKYGTAGKVILDGTEKLPTVLTGDAAKAAAQGMAKHAPEFTDFVRPLTTAETETVLQRAALDLNDPTLEASVKLARSATRDEPLTGDQVRRVVMNAVASNNPGADAQTVLGKTDDILRGAGMDILGDSERAGAYGSSLGERIGALREIGLAPEALAADRHSLGLGARQAGSIQTKLALDLAGGAAGAGVGMATEDPNDPNYYGKIAAKMLTGLGATAGLVHGSAYIARGVAKAQYAAREVFAPAQNLTQETQNWIRVWSGQTQLGHEMGRDFADRVWRAWGKHANLDTLAYIEERGELPPWMLSGKDAVDDPAAAKKILEEWIDIGKSFAEYGVVPDPIDVGASKRVKVYVPHVVDSKWQEAVSMGKGQNRPGRISTNPFWNYNQNRLYATINEGRSAPGYGTSWQYLDENIPRMLGNYLSAGVRARASANMLDALEARAAGAGHMPSYGPTLQRLMAKGEDVVRIGPRDLTPEGGVWAKNIEGLGGRYAYETAEGERTFISGELADVLGKLFRPQGIADLPGVRGMGPRSFMSLNSALKHNTLSGSLFHMFNEFRQFSATQGFNGVKNLPAIVKGTVNPGEYRAFMADPAVRDEAWDAIKHGLTLNTLSEGDVAGTPTRILTTLLDTAGGAVAGHQAAAAAGLSPEDQTKWTLGGAAMGAAATIPFIPGTSPVTQGKVLRSIVETASDALWQRTIPLMKLTTYEMYAPQFAAKVGEQASKQAAAEFANTVFGGNNLQAIARSRTVQDVMRMTMLAPDWTESWARLVGTSVLNTPTGEMARGYWTNAAIQSAFLLEGMNMALGGHWSWENDPDHTYEVDATNLYHWAFGPKSTIDANGNPFTPYIDVLGPYKGLMQPILELGKAGSTAALKAAGIDPYSLPMGAGRQVAGYFPKPGEPQSMALPAPDPNQKIADFIQARGGAIGSNVAQFLDDRDYAGRPLDRTEDPVWQRAINRVVAAAPHMIPTSVSQIITSGTRGEPLATSIPSAILGTRLSHGNEAERFFDMQDQYIKDTGHDATQWQTVIDAKRNDDLKTDQDIDALLSLQKDPTATYADRGKAISKLTGDRISMNELRRKEINSRLATTNLPEDVRLRDEALWLSQQTPLRGEEVPADIDWSKGNIDLQNAIRMAWNRDPETVKKLQEGGRRGIGTQAGLDAAGELRRQRQVWTADVAKTYDIDMDVLQDAIKAQLYGDQTLPPIPGITSGQLDDIATAYSLKGRDARGEDLDPTQAAMEKSTYLSDTVNALNAANPGGPQIKQQDLARRIQLRNSALVDQSPEAVSYNQAEVVRQRVNALKYVNPDGSPFLNEQGKPSNAEDWARWDQELEVASNRQQKHGSTYIQGDPLMGWKPDERLNQLDEARRMGAASVTKQVLRDPSITPAQREAYFQWEGEGSALNPTEWKQFKDGTLDQWSDAKKFPGGVLPKDEWNRRVAATRLWSSLTREERLHYDDQNVPNPRPLIEWKGETDPLGPAYEHNRGTLAEYMAYLGRVRNQRYVGLRKIQGLDPEEPENVSSGG